ncbi:MAG: PfaD family polyunsaturated fatty acid/polyketide biosynthesis protein [Alphaproteobacteria bacterium]|nr:PfaD family polyunsaturated fatty acid/polyketide biosynthesis protein [Alphaproteobacteria bacterium]
MSLASHFQALSAYRATAVRIVPTNGEPEDLMSEGGGLQETFDSLGRSPLLGVLRDPMVGSVVLADGGLQIRLQREGTRGRLAVQWDDDVILDQGVDIPPIESAWPGAWFRPAGVERSKNKALADLARPVYAVRDVDGEIRYHDSGTHGPGLGQLPLLGSVGPLGPEDLGSKGFCAAHGVKWAYIAGAMAGGIASADLVVAMSNAGLLGFFGAGGLPLDAVDKAVADIASRATGAWGANLLHNPAEPTVEEETVDLYLKHGVRKVSASAYMRLTPAVVRYRLAGIHRDESGRIVCPNAVFAKISRAEVATHFLQPAPSDILEQLVARGDLTADQLELARKVPVGSCITAEADSGGHTDHRALVVLLPQMLALRDAMVAEHRYAEPVYVGAAGGLGTPGSIWGAFAMGADYVLTGSVNQATREAGTSDLVKGMLGEAAPTDVASGPAPDMFEIGAKVQVLSRGSMYAQRAQRLYDLYQTAGSIEAIPEKERSRIEKQFFKRSLDEVWEGTREYWQQRDPAQVAKAERDPRHKMALTFRWYLGMTSRWARLGEDDRKRDFQIWCGPAMGGFNEWARGGALEDVSKRTVVGIAEALMRGAAVEARRVKLGV